jgi:hypothetical protein
MTLELDEVIGGRLPAPDRKCGRCQCSFPGDPALCFQSEWALCPACSAILLPERQLAPTRRRPRDLIPTPVS